MRKSIPLSSILLYLNNPRLSKSLSEYESLCKMIDDQKQKLILLAKDIVAYGMSELDLLAVFPAEKQGKYRVAEGNRRVSVLKLLQHPERIAKDYPTISKQFSDISKKANIDFNHIDVVIFKSETDPKLLHFLQIRHLGENFGIGTVKWSTTQKARFDYRTFGKENLVIFLDSLEERNYLTREEIDGVTQTNWQRIFRPIGLNWLKLKKDGQSYKILTGYEEEFKIKIKMIAENLKNKSVAKVYDQEKITEFITELETKYQQYVQSNRNPSPVTTLTFSKDSNTNNLRATNSKLSAHDVDEGPINEEKRKPLFEQNNTHKVTAKTHQRMPSDPFKGSKTVIPSSIRIQSRNHRINQIISELKSLEVETYPNACGCLLRALIELSAKEYLEKNNKSSNFDATKIEFRPAIDQAVSRMTQKQQLNSQDATTVKKETDKGAIQLLFNGYMHNIDVYPSPIVIKTIFQTYYKFIRECLL